MRLTILFVVLLFSIVNAGDNDDNIEEDKLALLEFINSMSHSRDINWKESSPPCTNWTGVTCNWAGSRVISLRLPGIGLAGEIPPNTLSKLTHLQILSLRSNRLTGKIPDDLAKLRNLTMLFLQYNSFSGKLPEFGGWRKMAVLNLSNNKFSGEIPRSVSSMVEVVVLELGNNSLSGEIPEISLPSLVVLDLSNNNLTGVVPRSLSRFPMSSFRGNRVVGFGGSVNSTPDVTKPGEGEGKGKGRGRDLWRETWFVAVVIACGSLAVVAFGCLMLACCCARRRGDDEGFNGKFPKGSMSSEKGLSGAQEGKNNGLVFFEGCNYAFDLEDLLRASAEVLGKGTFGMSYKAILEDANVVVVKRLKEVSAGKKEFEVQMDLIGSVRHENVVALRAYYYSKDEKLMVSDHCGQGSVSAMLHNQRGEDRIPMDWETRLKIAVGAARGITHIHSVNGGKFVHGNIRSSNIFLNPHTYGCVSDFGLATVMSPLAPPISRAAGYRAPEIADTRKATQASDVYSFGVFLLELLTGKSPVHATGGDELVHLVRWVHSVVREEWTAEVFDLELLRFPHVEEEMVEMLQIALSCVARVPDQRPKMTDLLKMIEDVRHSLTEAQPQ